MDAILRRPGRGAGADGLRQPRRPTTASSAASARYAGRVHVIDAVPPQELLLWSASSDVMVMLYQPSTENHEHVTPQKLWEAMSAGVPVVASDLPGFRSIVPVVGCGVLVDPTDRRVRAPAVSARCSTWAPMGCARSATAASRPRTRPTTGRPSSRSSTRVYARLLGR